MAYPVYWALNWSTLALVMAPPFGKVAATFPNGGAITKANVDQFKAQYTG